MAHTSSEKYKVPSGLRPLLEALARETLRAQPTDLISFSQLFFEELQHHRSESGKNADILKDPVLYERFKNDLQMKYQESIGTSAQNARPQSPMDVAATKIQAAFRGHIVRANPEKFGLDKPAHVVQRRRSNEHIQVADTRKDLNESDAEPMQKSADERPHETDGRHSVGGYTLEKDTPEDRAATKIQAEIRGFLARKHVQSMKKEGEEAATKIQAHIRGYLTRKHLEEAGVVSPSRSRSSIHSSRSEDIDKA
ncbi:Sperm surface protein Sp17 [Toxocara canis]|uniref:Sperm surface protein Sp17 n=1 Tax=Toxocara canis TaxID=6265 RepID=A0A0B2URZ0_TOXCA|nr:Sperm surface protein Sp17 [Toxocara canis]